MYMATRQDIDTKHKRRMCNPLSPRIENPKTDICANTAPHIIPNPRTPPLTERFFESRHNPDNISKIPIKYLPKGSIPS